MGLRLHYRLGMWAFTSASRAISVVAELLVLSDNSHGVSHAIRYDMVYDMQSKVRARSCNTDTVHAPVTSTLTP